MSTTAVHPKTFATLQARAALAGVVLHELRDDRGLPEYIATRWAMTKALATLEDVEAWLNRIGAPG